MSRAARWALGLAALSLCGGCAEDLTGFSELIRSRALAGRVEVVGDAPRATPRPGEQAHVEIFIGDPGAELPRSYALVVCEPSAGSLGTSFCASFDAPIAAATVLTPPSGPAPYPNPSIDFTVPAELAEEVDELLVLGVFCAGGQADLPGVFEYFGRLADGSATGAPPVCDAPDLHGEIFTLRVPLERAPEDRNDNPSVGAVLLDEAPLSAKAPADAPPEGCAALGLPLVPWAAELPLGLEAAADAREPITLVDPLTDERSESVETLQITYVATAGELERTHGFIDPEEDSLLDTLLWEPPAAAGLPPEGLLVRFFFILRDGRGGVALAERAICLTAG